MISVVSRSLEDLQLATENSIAKIISGHKGAGLNACGRIQQQSPDLWDCVYNEETWLIFI
jgi:hypothetical protein